MASNGCEKFLADGVARRAKSTPDAKATTLANLTGTTSFRQSGRLRRPGSVKAIVENVNARGRSVHGRSKRSSRRAETIFAVQHVELSIAEMAAATERPDRFVGLHFFNPVPMMKLVEVVRGARRPATTRMSAGLRVRADAGQGADRAQDSPGFVVNLLLVPYLLDAIRAVENGIATVEDIDKGMKLGCGYPMGPFTLLDFVGLDTTYYIANIMFDEYREPSTRRRRCSSGWCWPASTGGRSGKGFYRVLTLTGARGHRDSGSGLGARAPPSPNPSPESLTRAPVRITARTST